MSSITVKYTDSTVTTINGTSVSVVAVPGADYRHDDKPVDTITFTLGTATSCTINVTPSGSAMPAQTCFSGAAPSLTLPFTADWAMSTGTLGVLKLTIPASGTATYPARLEVVDGGNIEIAVKH